MVTPHRIDPLEVYDDGSLGMALGLPEGTLARARREGRLRFTKKGNRRYYLGSWVLTWLEEEQHGEDAMEVSRERP